MKFLPVLFTLPILFAGSAMAQTAQISTGVQTMNISGTQKTTTHSWETYEGLNLAVQAGGSISSIDITPRGTDLGSLNVGSIAGLSLFFTEGGSNSSSVGVTNFSGQTVSGFTSF